MRQDRARDRLDRSTLVSLVAMGLGIFVVANDFTALSVAVVRIEDDLDTTLRRAQWVINAYTVVFGVMIVTGGRLADMHGRRRLFLVGAGVFATFSLLGGLAPTIDLVIAARALMGIGGALMWPAVLGMTYAILPESKAGLAGGLVIGVAGLGNAMGPVLAGFLTDSFGWRWVFLVNVPVALVAMAITLRTVEESRAGRRIAVDYKGIAIFTSAVVLVLLGLDRGVGAGFDDRSVVALLVIGVALLGVFVLVELEQGPDALVPRRVLANSRFSGAVGSVLLVSAIFFGILLYVPQFTQKHLGWSPLEAGAGLLPLMMVFAASSFVAGRLYERFGAAVLAGAGAGLLSLGTLWVGLMIGSDYRVLVPGLVVAGAGIGLYYSAITTAAITAVPSDDGSLAGAVVYMANVAGGSIGIGLNTAIVLSAGTLIDGVRTAFVVDASLGLLGTLVALVFLRRRTAPVGSAGVPEGSRPG